MKRLSFIFLTLLIVLGGIDQTAGFFLRDYLLSRIQVSYFLKPTSKKCPWKYSLKSDPFLGYKHSISWPCTYESINRDGFMSDEFPLERNSNYFDILLLGGSVAANMYNGESVEKNGYLKIEMEKLQDSQGRKVRLFTTAIGAWKQPQQLHSYLEYGDRFDAIFSIEGFNEIANFEEDKIFENPVIFLWQIFSLPDVPLHDEMNKYIWRQLSLYESLLKKTSFLYQAYALLSAKDLQKKHDRFFSKSYANKVFSTKEQTDQEFYFQYKNYLKTLQRFSKLNGQQNLIFIQPALYLLKNRTPIENSIVERMGESRATDVRKKYLNFLESLKKDNEMSEVFSLVNIFENESRDLYKDEVHFKFQKGRSLGQELMSQKIINELKSRWGLKSRP